MKVIESINAQKGIKVLYGIFKDKKLGNFRVVNLTHGTIFVQIFDSEKHALNLIHSMNGFVHREIEIELKEVAQKCQQEKIASIMNLATKDASMRCC